MDLNDFADEKLRQVAERCLHVHIESNSFPLDKSLFKNKPTALEVANKMRKKSIAIFNKENYLEPVFYLWHTHEGKETVMGMSLANFMDMGPLMSTAIVANILSQTDSHGYAVAFSAWTAQRPLKDIRVDPELDKFPARKESLVFICEYQDGDKAYIVHDFKKADDIVVWAKQANIEDVPDHAIPGRFWSLFHIAPMLKEYHEADHADWKEKVKEAEKVSAAIGAALEGTGGSNGEDGAGGGSPGEEEDKEKKDEEEGGEEKEGS